MVLIVKSTSFVDYLQLFVKKKGLNRNIKSV